MEIYQTIFLITVIVSIGIYVLVKLLNKMPECGYLGGGQVLCIKRHEDFKKEKQYHYEKRKYLSGEKKNDIFYTVWIDSRYTDDVIFDEKHFNKHFVLI